MAESVWVDSLPHRSAPAGDPDPKSVALHMIEMAGTRPAMTSVDLWRPLA
ncbi:hypothetical protein [Microvirga lotononidis]|uniref:Uncharacterized protein n=1 Tax=Microvirga lotononidis TaxID=864069 RepID=I4Z082_9HYPH|nr:hypothetical protein [Microvirga lotononidis]EIM29624.1 hypothetical protein MicloDRAFT_00021050 [Microvirga lotononidis]WQO27073.1 hypothetical protein U0023_20840 [Microvirga lotononidis]